MKVILERLGTSDESLWRIADEIVNAMKTHYNHNTMSVGVGVLLLAMAVDCGGIVAYNRVFDSFANTEGEGEEGRELISELKNAFRKAVLKVGDTRFGAVGGE